MIKVTILIKKDFMKIVENVEKRWKSIESVINISLNGYG